MTGIEGPKLLSDNDYYYFQEGTHTRLWSVLGAHTTAHGTYFAVWAPNAKRVSLIGDFNHWQPDMNPLAATGRAGVWQTFVGAARHGSKYQFLIESNKSNYVVRKADPFGIFQDTPPQTASILWDLNYDWGDSEWMQSRAAANGLQAPISIYEVHLGSWRRGPGGRHLTYSELGDQLIPYVKEMGFTHVEFMPVMEHPFYGSWGYQVTGYFAPTSRYGSPQDFMRLIDRFHQAGIGVILDWVPSHFPNDEYGLGYFDGTQEFEPADPQRRVHPDWNSYLFDYGKPEVRSFLLSSAMFWLQQYHADALRVDAVASMLYLDYSRKPGEWSPNQYGGRENLDAIALLRVINEDVYAQCPDVQTIAEESTAWPNVSRPTYANGLGFGMKWDMGWMHDTLDYLSVDPLYRKQKHGELTFRAAYAFSENFVLPLSHDEVVYGKGSLIRKMPGDDLHKCANLRALFGYMYAQPGKKLLFMGAEFGQWSEWAHEGQLQWDLLSQERHAGLRLLVGELNHLYRTEQALHAAEFDPACFEWIRSDDAEHNVIAFLRKHSDQQQIAVLCNFSAAPWFSYRIGVPRRGRWRELLNTNASAFGGSGLGNNGALTTVPVGLHSRPYSLTIDLPPLSVLYLKWEGEQ